MFVLDDKDAWNIPIEYRLHAIVRNYLFTFSRRQLWRPLIIRGWSGNLSFYVYQYSDRLLLELFSLCFLKINFNLKTCSVDSDTAARMCIVVYIAYKALSRQWEKIKRKKIVIIKKLEKIVIIEKLEVITCS